MKEISKEATLKEVLAHVSVLDVWTAIKSAAFAVGCLGVLAGIGFVFAWGWKVASAPTFTLPAIAWISFIVAGYMWFILGERSWREFSINFYYPKASFWNWLLSSGWVIATIEVFRLSFRFGPPIGPVLFWFGYVFMVAPAFLFFSLINLGHQRLMEARLAEDRQ